MQASKKCAWCGEDASLTCGSCNAISYCSKSHQKDHWKIHKENCKVFIEESNKDDGRYLVSSRDLPSGHLIIKEEPICLGPSATSSLVCLSCHLPILEKKFYRCPTCLWPMCSSICSSAENHQLECKVLKQDPKKIGVPLHEGETPRYDLILIIRCLLLRDTDEEKWRKILNLQSHAEERKELSEPHHMAAVRYLIEVVKYNAHPDEIHQVRGAIITNSIKTKTAEGVVLRGIYPSISLLNHSCIPNVTMRSDKFHNLYIRSTVPVAKGEALTFSYVPIIDPLWKRQNELSQIYFFDCQCKRCLDPQELGTHYSSPKCPNCKDSFVEPTDEIYRPWICRSCSTQQTVNNLVGDVNEELQSIGNKRLQLKHCRLFMKGMADKWHKQHYLYVEALQKMLAFAKKNSGIDLIKLAKELWKESLDLFSILEPGHTRRRGVSLVEYSSALLDLVEKDKSVTEQMDSYLQEALAAIEEGIKILKLEPKNSTESKWAELAELKRQKMNSLVNINQLKNQK